ncbi:22975_t:CDS:2 [Rhizophagus irregularis]|nr:22975_t:CDS:2 [Rhizophagus irregularis]
MFNSSQNNRDYGKCCAIESSERCGCQRFIALNNGKTCEVCNHHYGYHEDKEENRLLSNRQRVSTLDELYTQSNNSNITQTFDNQETDTSLSTNSVLNQLLAGRALEEQSIANELSKTFAQSRLVNNNQLFDLSLQMNRNKRRKHVEIKPKIKEMCVTVIVLPDVGPQLKMPTIIQPRYEKIRDAGLIKDITFKETDNIIQKIESNFPALADREWTFRSTSTNHTTVEYVLTDEVTLNFALIKRLLVNRTKLYLSPKYLPIQLPQEEDTQLEWVDIEVDDDSLRSTGRTSGSTIRSDESLVEITEIDSSDFYKNKNKNVDNFIQEILTQLQVDNCISGMNMIKIENTIDVVDNIMDWIKHTTDVDLLKKPFISVTSERVADAGGVFLHVIQKFWDQIKDYKFGDCGNTKLFDTRKLLFWCLIHDGAWPHWIDNFHFKFIFEMEIDYIQVIENLQPNVYKIIEKILDYEEELKLGMIEMDIAQFIAKFEIEDSRISQLNDLKKGFDVFKIVEKKLYKVVISESDLLEQFDTKMNIKRIEGKVMRETCYLVFFDYLRSLKIPLDRKNVLRFICGRISIPLPDHQKIQIKWKNSGSKEQQLLRIPHAKTCMRTIWLSDNYEENEIEIFRQDLKIALEQSINNGFCD